MVRFQFVYSFFMADFFGNVSFFLTFVADDGHGDDIGTGQEHEGDGDVALVRAGVVLEEGRARVAHDGEGRVARRLAHERVGHRHEETNGHARHGHGRVVGVRLEDVALHRGAERLVAQESNDGVQHDAHDDGA